MQRDYIGYLIALVSVVVGVYVSWYYYDKSVQQRQPIFSVDLMPSTVFDSKEEMHVPLKVTREDGQPLTKSVHVANPIFWNAGNLPINASDVLTPVRLSLTAPSVELLAVSTLKQSRKVTDCAVRQESPTSFTITFRILEQGDGCQVRIFYAGPKSPGYRIEGEIVGVKRLAISGESIDEYFERTKDSSDLHERVLRHVPRILLWISIVVLAALYLRALSLPRKHAITLAGAIALMSIVILGVDRLNSSFRVIDSPLSANTSNWTGSSAP